MKKIIETQRAPGAIGPYVQGIDLGSMVFTSGLDIIGLADLARNNLVRSYWTCWLP